MSRRLAPLPRRAIISIGPLAASVPAPSRGRDRATMTQTDSDIGRLMRELGVARVHPAGFVIFRIGQSIHARDRRQEA